MCVCILQVPAGHVTYELTGYYLCYYVCVLQVPAGHVTYDLTGSMLRFHSDPHLNVLW